MRNLIFDWPISFFIVFFAIQLFGVELLSKISAPVAGNPLIPFVARIALTLGVWIYLFPDAVNAFRLPHDKFPGVLVALLLLYSVCFLPIPVPSVHFDGPKILLHLLISSWEELLMRGLLLWLLLQAYPSNTSSVLILVGCAFGVLHLLNLVQGAAVSEVLPQVVWSSVLGIAFTVVTYKTGSIIPAILLHSAFNLIPALMEGKPWILQKTIFYGISPIAVVILLFLPLLVFSLRATYER